MPRLRNERTGVVVNVSDDTAAALGSAWSPADVKREVNNATTTKTSRKTETKSKK